MKVLHLISGGDTGGAKTHVLNLLKNLMQDTQIQLVCFMEGDFSRSAHALKIPTTVIEKPFFLALRALRTKLKSEDFDIIHCHGARGNLLGVLLKPYTKALLVTTVHSDYKLDYLGRPAAKLTYGLVNSFALRLFDYRIGVSEFMRRTLISRKFQANKIFTIYNGIDFSNIPPRVDREKYYKALSFTLPRDAVVVGIAARLNPVKDISTLLRGFAIAQAQCPNMRLVIAGDGEEEQQLRALSAELNISEKVCFAGWVDDMYAFYSTLDINTLTSLSETFPYALTEGTRYNLPTVSSRTGGVPLLIEHGETGFLFEPGDHKALGALLIKLAQDKPLRQALGDSLREKTEREFSLKATRDRQREIYDELLKRQRSKRSRSGVLICGAYGHGNAGDDAMLEAIVRDLRQVDPSLGITVMSKVPKETAKFYGVHSIYTFNLFRLFPIMRKSKLFINGGGNLIQDVTSRRSLWYYLFTIKQAKRLGCKVLMYGCGIGPVLYKDDVRLTRAILNSSVDIITLREDHSLKEARRFGITEPEIILSADPALALSAANDTRIDFMMETLSMPQTQNYICFALRQWECKTPKAACFAAAANHAYEVHGLIPVFLSINHRSDGDAAREVIKLLRCPYRAVFRPQSSGLTIGLLSRMTAVVSMRLHGLIFAAGQGVPLVGIAYDPKVAAFLDYIGSPLHTNLEDVTAAGLITLIDSAIELSSQRELLAENVRRLTELERLNVDAVRKLLDL